MSIFETGLYRRWRSIRNKSFHRLLHLMWHVESEDGRIRRNIVDRKRGLMIRNMIFEVRDEDIMDVLGCSKRTAFDYRETMRAIHALLKSHERE